MMCLYLECIRVKLLKKRCVKSWYIYLYVYLLRKDLLNSLEHRFKDVEENEAYLFSTYLDPVFGYKAFDKQMKQIVKNKIITVLQVEAIKENAKDQAFLIIFVLNIEED